MLFSRPDVASFINNYFEPVWESVRPVPLVRIDFGNGMVVTRTLHGNIATYVCSADGQILDILPGIYSPAAYLHGLDQFRLLANYVDQRGKDQRLVRLQDYHRRQAEALQQNQPPARFINVADMSKMVIERGVKAMLVPGGKATPGSLLGGGDGFACSAKAPEPQCAQFLAYIDSPSVQKRIGSTSFGLPVRRGTENSVTDPNLRNPWGVVVNPSGDFWVANAASGTATLYHGDVNGSPVGQDPPVVKIPAAPGWPKQCWRCPRSPSKGDRSSRRRRGWRAWPPGTKSR